MHALMLVSYDLVWIMVEAEGGGVFVGFEGEGVEGVDVDVLVGLDDAAMETEGGGVFVEVTTSDFNV